MKTLLEADPHPHHVPRLLKVRRNKQITEGLGTYLLKSLSDFLADSLAQELQDSCMPGDCRLDILSPVVHRGYTDPEENVHYIYRYITNPSPQRKILPLPLCFKHHFSIFSAWEKSTKGTTGAPIYMICLNASLCVFCSVLFLVFWEVWELMSIQSGLLWNFLPSPHAWKNTKSNRSRVFAGTGFFLPAPNTRSLSRWYQYCYRYLLLGCAVDIHSPHVCKRCQQ